MKKRKLLSLILSAALTLSLTACSENSEKQNTPNDNSSSTVMSTPEASGNSETADSGYDSKDNSSDNTGNSDGRGSDSNSGGSGSGEPEGGTSTPESSSDKPESSSTPQSSSDKPASSSTPQSSSGKPASSSTPESSSSKPASSSTPESSSDKPSTIIPIPEDPEDIYTLSFWKNLPYSPASDFEYKILAEGIEVTKYTGTSDTVKVPTMIDGEPVRKVSIEDSTIKIYYPPDGITEFTLPPSTVALYVPGSLEVYNDNPHNTIIINGKRYANNVTVDKWYVDKLESITFGEGIIAVGSNEHTKLKFIHFPLTLKDIVNNSFSKCPVKGVAIPTGVSPINPGVFADCPNLKYVTFDQSRRVYSKAFANTPYYKDIEAKSTGIVMLGATVCDGSKCTGDVVIPDGCTHISANAFKGNEKITSVTIPASVARIDSYVFSDCVRLKKVTINGNPTIYGFAFSGCLRLEEVSGGGTPSSQNAKVFDNCPNLKTKPF